MKNEDQKEVEIKSASLGDALCSYSYELLTGKTAGDVLNRKGNHIVHEDLEKAFSMFNVFFAHLDDAFTGNDNSTELSTLEEDVNTQKYNVFSFKISGVEENRSLIISATKYVTSGVVKFDSPKVKLSGSYLYLTQLNEVLENALDEVEAYMNGKSAPQMEQTVITFAQEDSAFETAKVED
ncbi:hypothetical protein [Flavobacterium sp. 102]|uniref:hypothetical protein n=1 Tax=Flavobacterium sp. 102 TaxID=2135623 RepID=UPI000EB0A6C6|nr:hypothetical protein [Flavobacterium sp. 102]RKS00452.1 hypothetical protein C8C84_0062 [Flavobacterium sp. 102]